MKYTQDMEDLYYLLLKENQEIVILGLIFLKENAYVNIDNLENCKMLLI